MKTKKFVLLGLAILVLFGFHYLNKNFFGFNLIDNLFLGNGEKCGSYMLGESYGNCNKGYYCKPDPILWDVPGNCIKIVSWKSYTVYNSSNLYYSNIDLQIEVKDYKHLSNKAYWEVEFKKGSQTENEQFIMEEFGKIKFNKFGYNIYFKDEDGASGRALKTTISLF